MRLREPEALGHDADDRVQGGSQPDLPADDGGVACEAALPRIVPDHHHGRRTRPFIVLDQVSSEHGGNAGEREAGRRDLGHLDRYWRTVRWYEVALDGAERAEVFHGSQLVAPEDEVV